MTTLSARARTILAMMLVGMAACSGGIVARPEPTITTLAQPGEWSPLFAIASDDGSRIAFYGWDPTNKTRVGLVEEGKLVPVTRKGMSALDFAWMPDSRSLLVGYGPLRRPARFAIVDLAGNLIRQVPFKGDFTVAWHGMTVSNDGAAAVVSATRSGVRSEPSDLVALDIRSGDYENLTNTPRRSESSPSYIDSHRLVFAAGIDSLAAGKPNGWAGLLDLSSGGTRRLSPRDQVVESVTADWGTDTAFFEAFREGDRASQAIWTVRLSDGRTQRLITKQVTYPSVYRHDILIATDIDSGALLRVSLN